MRSRKKLYAVLALLLVAVLILPTLAGRMAWEKDGKVYVATIDASRLEKFYEPEEIPGVLKDYRDAGVTTIQVWQWKASGYNVALLDAARDLGMTIALVPDVAMVDGSGLEQLVRDYPVKYICLRLSQSRKGVEVPMMTARICRMIREYDLTLVITENETQLGNQHPPVYETYLEAAGGNLLRCFTTYPKSSLIHGDYPVLYHQMYSSVVDRNTQFILIKHMDDEGYTPEESAQRAQQSIRLLTEKLRKEGYVSEGRMDFSTYQVNLRPACAGAAALAVLMVLMMLELLFKQVPEWLHRAGLAAAAGILVITFVMPESLLSLYPTAFCMVAPSFGMTVCLDHLNRNGEKLSLAKLVLSILGIALATMAVSGGTVAAMLSGQDYFLNDGIFRGVKAMLLVPMVLAALLIAAEIWNVIADMTLRMLVRGFFRKLRWYHLLLAAVLGAAGALYVIRSGNVSTISFTELYMRNLLGEIFAARPRTKEFLIGWPSLVLFVYCVKTARPKLLQAVFAMGSAMLFASCMNTFCHVFTMAGIMYLRLLYGFLIGAVIAAAAVLVVHLFFRLVQRKT